MDKDLLDFLQAFREEITKRFDEVSQRFDKMDRETSQRFDWMRRETSQQFDEMGRETSQQFEQMGRETSQRFEQMGRRVDETSLSLREEIHSLRSETTQRFEKLETEVRGLYIVVENLRGAIQLVAEGVTSVTQQLKKQGEEFARRLDTIESFTRLCYQDLDARVRRLEAT